MTDITIRHVDGILAERIEALARARGWAINDVLLHALRHGLGFSTAQDYSEFARDPDALKKLGADWPDAERGVFNEAMLALARSSPTQLSPERVGVDPAARAVE